MQKKSAKKLNFYRKKVQKLDRELLALLKKRLDVVKRIGALKVAEGLPLRDRTYENESIEKLADIAMRYGFSHEFVTRLFKEIMRYSLNSQKRK